MGKHKFSVFSKVNDWYIFYKMIMLKFYKISLKSIIPNDYGYNEFSLNDIFKEHNRIFNRSLKIKKLL